MPRTVLLLMAALCLADVVQGQQRLATVPLASPPATGASAREAAYASGPTATSRLERATRNSPVRLVRTSPQARQPSRARYGEAIPLPAFDRSARESREPARERSGGGMVPSVVFSSLAIVLGLFFLIAWIARRAFPKNTTALPTDVLEVLGRSPLASRHNLQLIRLGRRLLLISVTADGAETLTEITDPDEVNHLSGLCRQAQAGSIAGSFRQVLQQLGTQETPRSRRARQRAESADAPLAAEHPLSLRNLREHS